MKVIELKIDKTIDELGVFAVSIVDKPAIKKLFMKFNEEPVAIKFAINEEQMVITGPAMIPDIQMYRSAGSMGLAEEAMVFFSAASIRNAAEQFLAMDVNNNVTLEHQNATTGLTLRESWIIEDPKMDKAAFYGFTDLPTGTWMLSYNVNDITIWNKIKAGEFNGFSIEAFFIPKASDIPVDESAFGEEDILDDDFLVRRSAGDTQETFVSRCIAHEVGAGMDSSQAAAVCYAKWDASEEERFSEEFLNLVVEFIEMNKIPE